MRVDTYDGRAFPDFWGFSVRERKREREGGKTDYVLFHAFVRLVKHVFDSVTGLQGFALEV